MNMVRRNTRRPKLPQHVRSGHYQQLTNINHHGLPVLYPPLVDSYGSPASSPITQDSYYQHHGDTYPNALHVIPPDIGFKNNDDTEDGTKHDEYGSPLAPVTGYDPLGEADTKNKFIDLSDNNILESKLEFGETNKSKDFENQVGNVIIQELNFLGDAFVSNNISEGQNNESEDIIQQPSFEYPDQNNPEKYVNNDHETLKKVINTPLFYNDKQDYLTT